MGKPMVLTSWAADAFGVKPKQPHPPRGPLVVDRRYVPPVATCHAIAAMLALYTESPNSKGAIHFIPIGRRGQSTTD